MTAPDEFLAPNQRELPISILLGELIVTEGKLADPEKYAIGSARLPELQSRKEALQWGVDALLKTPRLLAALDGVLALHKVERRWLPFLGADRSYDTAVEAAQDLDHTLTIDPANMPYFEVCAHCKIVEDGPCDGECTKENGYRESLWPCPTVAAVTTALEGQG